MHFHLNPLEIKQFLPRYQLKNDFFNFFRAIAQWRKSGYLKSPERTPTYLVTFQYQKDHFKKIFSVMPPFLLNVPLLAIPVSVYGLLALFYLQVAYPFIV